MLVRSLASDEFYVAIRLRTLGEKELPEWEVEPHVLHRIIRCFLGYLFFPWLSCTPP